MKDFKNSDTALIGCGYWGTNIAKVLNKIKKNKIIIYDENYSNAKTLKKRFNYHTGGRRTGNYTVVGTGSAEWNSTTAVTGFRFLTNTGNLDSMYYVVYGLVI